MPTAEMHVTPISEDVFPGWHHALGRGAALRRRIHRSGRLPYHLLLRLDAHAVYGAFEYVLAAARKPL
jgi:hypothetical protein